VKTCSLPSAVRARRGGAADGKERKDHRSPTIRSSKDRVDDGLVVGQSRIVSAPAGSGWVSITRGHEEVYRTCIGDGSAGLEMSTGNFLSGVLFYPCLRGKETSPIPVPAKCHGVDFLPILVPRRIIPVGFSISALVHISLCDVNYLYIHEFILMVYKQISSAKIHI